MAQEFTKEQTTANIVGGLDALAEAIAKLQVLQVFTPEMAQSFSRAEQELIGYLVQVDPREAVKQVRRMAEARGSDTSLLELAERMLDSLG